MLYPFNAAKRRFCSLERLSRRQEKLFVDRPERVGGQEDQRGFDERDTDEQEHEEYGVGPERPLRHRPQQVGQRTRSKRATKTDGLNGGAERLS